VSNGGEYIVDWLFDYCCEKQINWKRYKTARTYAPTQ
jgi:hypothetical protein